MTSTMPGLKITIGAKNKRGKFKTIFCYLRKDQIIHFYTNTFWSFIPNTYPVLNKIIVTVNCHKKRIFYVRWAEWCNYKYNEHVDQIIFILIYSESVTILINSRLSNI